MGSHSESTNSGARIDEVGDNFCAQIAEEFASVRAMIAANIRYERQTQLMLGCAGVCLLAGGFGSCCEHLSHLRTCGLALTCSRGSARRRAGAARSGSPLQHN